MSDCGAIRIPLGSGGGGTAATDGNNKCEHLLRRERTVPLSPRLALRRVLILAEGRQFREAATVLGRLGPTGLAVVSAELPLDILVESLPHSAQLLETLFTKLSACGQRPSIAADSVVWKLVRLLASYEDPTLRLKIAKLARSLAEWQPDFRNLLLTKKKAFEQAVDGLGCHGLTTADGNSGLLHLHAALKVELQRHVDAYKAAVHQLDELHTPQTLSKRPTDASHHRLLLVRHADIQQRLIDNKTLLTMVEKPALEQLWPLIQTLETRVQNDKEALFCLSELKRLQSIVDDQPVAPLLISFSKGCTTLLQLMQNNNETLTMTIPNNTSSSNCSDSSCSDGYHSETEIFSHIKKQQENLIDRFRALYMQKRPRALEALDSLPELMHATQLKAKILFSIVILSYRCCRNMRESKIEEVLKCLELSERTQPGRLFRTEIMKCLGASAEAFVMHGVEQRVHQTVCATLEEYACLVHCAPLFRYIQEVARVAWVLVTHLPPYELDMDFTTSIPFQSDKHALHHSVLPLDKSKPLLVQSFIWPALTFNGTIIQKAVVTTATTHL